MNHTGTFAGLGATALLLMLLLGAYHGINPGMGWLFAVAIGMQERSSAAVGRSLLPIALGHGLAIGAVVLLAVLLGTVIPLTYIKVDTAHPVAFNPLESSEPRASSGTGSSPMGCPSRSRPSASSASSSPRTTS